MIIHRYLLNKIDLRLSILSNIRYILPKLFFEKILNPRVTRKIADTDLFFDIYFQHFWPSHVLQTYLHGDTGDDDIILYNFMICGRIFLAIAFPFDDRRSGVDFLRRMRCFHRRWVQRLHANASISCSPACVGPSGPRRRNSLGWEMHENIACDLIVTCDHLRPESSKYDLNRNFRVNYWLTRSFYDLIWVISEIVQLKILLKKSNFAKRKEP